MKYIIHGVCPSAIDVELDGDIVKSVHFFGGCDGNHKGICSLIEGMKVTDVIDRLKGIRCGCRSTSCPDQLAVILEQIIDNK